MHEGEVEESDEYNRKRKCAVKCIIILTILVSFWGDVCLSSRPKEARLGLLGPGCNLFRDGDPLVLAFSSLSFLIA